MFEKVCRSLKYDSQKKFGPQTYAYIYIWTTTPITLPRDARVMRVRGKYLPLALKNVMRLGELIY